MLTTITEWLELVNHLAHISAVVERTGSNYASARYSEIKAVPSFEFEKQPNFLEAKSSSKLNLTSERVKSSHFADSVRPNRPFHPMGKTDNVATELLKKSMPSGTNFHV